MKHIQEEIVSSRMARDARAYVAEVHGLVEAAELKIREGGDADHDLTWALAYADRIDPLMSSRKDIEKMEAEEVGRRCPDCGQGPRSGRRPGTAIDATADVSEPIDPPGGRPVEQHQNAADSGPEVT